ncbi:hypothetical protein GCM10010495_36770 [Kitasatospora herbaricolor]|nr:hypothetical protein GCM10010495_36770 [Kitasatospora herbaricolor]
MADSATRVEVLASPHRSDGIGKTFARTWVRPSAGRRAGARRVRLLPPGTDNDSGVTTDTGTGTGTDTGTSTDAGACPPARPLADEGPPVRAGVSAGPSPAPRRLPTG